MGRWISEDPIGFAAGDTNVSRYVANDAVGFTDPTGLISPKKVLDGEVRTAPGADVMLYQEPGRLRLQLDVDGDSVAFIARSPLG